MQNYIKTKYGAKEYRRKWKNRKNCGYSVKNGNLLLKIVGKLLNLQVKWRHE